MIGLGIYGNSSGESDSEIDSEDGRRSSTPGERRRKPADMTDGQLQVCWNDWLRNQSRFE